MARRRFFVPSIDKGRATLEGEDAHHLTRVLRVEVGRQYEISDNQAAYLAEVVEAHKARVTFQVIEQLPPEPELPRITLLASLIKFDRMEWIVEKATELGVAEIVPVDAERSERGLLDAARKRVERWRRIAIEASQQSRRTHLPEIVDPRKLNQALTERAAPRFYLEESGAGKPLIETYEGGPLALLVGPEGGWTDHERERFGAAEWQPVTLGPQILRAETAALAALAIVAHKAASGSAQ